jgi:hypothetical protein
MLKLYCEPDSPAADAVEAGLKDLLLDYERVVTDPAAARPARSPASTSLPG